MCVYERQIYNHWSYICSQKTAGAYTLVDSESKELKENSSFICNKAEWRLQYNPK